MHNNQRAFTLIEILVAMAIFSIGILGMLSLQISTVRNTKSGDLITRATMLARDQIETLKRVTDVTTLSNGSEADIDVHGNPGGNFARSWTISNPLGGSNTRQITVSVSWNHKGENRSINLSTITKN
jgi:prepilin-type N-terminal cleavage/methylation domain-containing protein